jgi:hypothetical protein
MNYSLGNMLGGGRVGFTPLSLNPALWLSDTGSNAATWEDLSGNGRNATQSTGANQPSIVSNIINGRQIRRFDGVNDRMIIANMPLPTYISVFVVAQTPDSTNNKFFMEHGANAGTTNGFWFAGKNIGAWSVYRDEAFHNGNNTAGNWFGQNWGIGYFSYDGTSDLRLNGSPATNPAGSGTARSNSTVTTTLNIGSRNQTTLFLRADVAEILIFEGVLTTSQRKSVENYLSKKYAITVA